MKTFKLLALPMLVVLLLSYNFIPKTDSILAIIVFDPPITEDTPNTLVQLTLKDKQSWCKKDKDCTTLAEAGYYEARGESDAGVVSVLHTILNRVNKEGRWPNTIKEVVYQNKQFSYTHDGSMKHGMNDKKQVDRMLVLAYDVLHGLIDSPVGGSTHYHSTNVNPYWVSDVEYIANVDNHKFYRGDR